VAAQEAARKIVCKAFDMVTEMDLLPRRGPPAGGASAAHRTTVTGQWARVTTSSATEPSSMRLAPVRPSEPTMMW
jgi:hypothetical protein